MPEVPPPGPSTLPLRCPPADFPDDIWLRLEKKLGGRKPLLDLLGITEYDKEV